MTETKDIPIWDLNRSLEDVTENPAEQIPPVKQEPDIESTTDYKKRRKELNERYLQKLSDVKTRSSKYTPIKNELEKYLTAEDYKKEVEQLKDEEYFATYGRERPKKTTFGNLQKKLTREGMGVLSTKITSGTPKILRPAGFNERFVKPYSGAASRNFSLTKGETMYVDTGGFDTEDEFKKNRAIEIKPQSGVVRGKLTTKGSLSIPMEYNIPNSPLKIAVKNRAVAHAMNRAYQKSDMLSDLNAMLPKAKELSVSDMLLRGAYSQSEKNQMPLQSNPNQYKADYGKMVSTAHGAAGTAKQMSSNNSTIRTFKQPKSLVSVRMPQIKTITKKPKSTGLSFNMNHLSNYVVKRKKKRK